MQLIQQNRRVPKERGEPRAKGAGRRRSLAGFANLKEAAGLALVLASGCGGDDVDRAGAAELWERLQAEEYRAWSRAPGWGSRQPTVSAHGQDADIFINEVLVEALEETELTSWPPGSLLVKDSGGSLALVAAMEKRSDGWYFAEWDGSGTLKFAGSPSVCHSCHDAAEDSVFALGLP